MKSYRELCKNPDIRLYNSPLLYNLTNNLIALAEPLLTRATITTPDGEIKVDEVWRACEIAHVDQTDPSIKTLREIVCAITESPDDRLEPIQIVKYGVGGHFLPHHDCYGDDETDNNRQFTVIFYLNAPEKGGATTFPLLNIRVTSLPGNVLMFNNLCDDGKLNNLSLHSGENVEEGVKYIATCWVRQKKYT